MILYLVMAYRYTTTDNAFPIGVYSSREKAVTEAIKHRQFRGGKYDHKLFQFTVDDNFKDLCGGHLREGEWITGSFIKIMVDDHAN